MNDKLFETRNNEELIRTESMLRIRLNGRNRFRSEPSLINLLSSRWIGVLVITSHLIKSEISWSPVDRRLVLALHKHGGNTRRNNTITSNL